MKRTLNLILGIMLLSCGKGMYNIQLDRNYIEVDHRAHQFVINSDEDITRIGFNYAASDYDLQDQYYKEEINGTHHQYKCDWIMITIDYSDPYHFNVTLNENTSSKSRKAFVHANRLAGGDTLLIVQKGKPAPRK